ncbi:juvenile hormone acid O-methyltransferase-like [Anneissia japonica]|uniref:juvenile hormone acid O-methyltransferase-like n=1 Tax=Anneissia japonica TaxID=1529436 RepID=UPI001425501D|nr:juvenile hormone acid O-methyltransferase-like [Anneissia japonica]
MINVARQKYQRANVTYEVADANNFVEKFPKWEGRFDKVVSVHALHWVQDKASAMRNIYNCLKIDGECFLLFCGPTHQMLGQKPDELPNYLKHHSNWKKHLKGYVHRMYNQFDLDDTRKLLESVGFEVLSGTSHTPCENIDISSEDELKEYLRTLLGHLGYLPQQYHTEFIQDASDWCYKNFPINQLGNIYNKVTVIVVHAVKKQIASDT